MSFIADSNKEWEIWDYITGDFKSDMSIARDRYYYLWEINYDHPLKISLRDPDSDSWTKWSKFPGLLWKTDFGPYGIISSHLTAAVDVHRSILENEIIIESDYPTYEENYEAAKFVGSLIENKGFKPLYYYSGNKSIHIHVFFNWDCLKELDPIIQDQLRLKFGDSKSRFKKKFIEWLRIKMVTGWGTYIRKFDSGLIKASHLIRCELSKNKKGYKTFLGYTHKDMSFVPYICNEENRIYPKLGEIKLSSPHRIQMIVEDFMGDIETKTKKQKRQRSNRSLGDWGLENSPTKLRECVKCILSEDFKNVKDGMKRNFFVLLNELRSVLGDNQAIIIINDWNAKMGFPIKEQDIEYRMKRMIYNLSCKYIHNLLNETGIDISKLKCKI